MVLCYVCVVLLCSHFRITRLNSHFQITRPNSHLQVIEQLIDVGEMLFLMRCIFVQVCEIRRVIRKWE